MRTVAAVRRQEFCFHRLHPTGEKACVPEEKYILVTFMQDTNDKLLDGPIFPFSFVLRYLLHDFIRNNVREEDSLQNTHH